MSRVRFRCEHWGECLDQKIKGTLLEEMKSHLELAQVSGRTAPKEGTGLLP